MILDVVSILCFGLTDSRDLFQIDLATPQLFQQRLHRYHKPNIGACIPKKGLCDTGGGTYMGGIAKVFGEVTALGGKFFLFSVGFI